jgi:hypothetical protein
MNTRLILGLALAVTTLAGCGGSASSADRVVNTGATSSPVTTCATKDLAVALGQGDGAAGSVYEPLRFTNRGTSACTLRGYPGVSFVTAGSGDQVGAPASRNPQHPARTVKLAPGRTADAVVQIVDHGNYAPDQCEARAVSGLRVYPPGSKSAAYVPFHDAVTACSTDVTQLTVEAVAKAKP